MDKKSKALIWLFFIAILVSAGFTYYRTMVVRDFEVIESEAEVVTEGSEVEGEMVVEESTLETVEPNP